MGRWAGNYEMHHTSSPIPKQRLSMVAVDVRRAILCMRSMCPLSRHSLQAQLENPAYQHQGFLRRLLPAVGNNKNSVFECVIY